MSYCTSIHCIDGRIQEPIRKYLTAKYDVRYVDAITEAGPCGILAENKNRDIIDSIHSRTEISLQKHDSKLIAISGHHDCAGNPITDEKQQHQIRESIRYLGESYPGIEVIGFWIDGKWELNPLT